MLAICVSCALRNQAIILLTMPHLQSTLIHLGFPTLVGAVVKDKSLALAAPASKQVPFQCFVLLEMNYLCWVSVCL